MSTRVAVGENHLEPENAFLIKPLQLAELLRPIASTHKQLDPKTPSQQRLAGSVDCECQPVDVKVRIAINNDSDVFRKKL